ncbi:hypothetical protein JAAARDRAFT_37534 [Jaapia argillacea MUCL 33604]|uniref:Cytochrome P450 n=1 Tax=Jaapia argillacea MUCL 33604 TaxID=933084 RepID=A0A067PL49_9AGAM|nr:hypothetical protein JAAARDRAFT_37534 [Jaapia argillacea MUCL 33604]
MGAGVVYALIGGLVVAAYLSRSTRKKQSLPYPPGPKPLPLVGNVLDIPLKQLWLGATEWAKRYGEIVHLNVFGVSLVFLNSADVAFDLMEKRGAIYSDKPKLVMCGELCGCENMVAFNGYGDQMRRYRRLMQKALGTGAIKQYEPLLEIESHPFLRRLIAKPANYVDHIRRYAGTLTLGVVYGHQVTSDNDPHFRMAEDCVGILANEIASGGGIWPVDVFPSLQYLPNWFPGAGFKAKAVVWKKKMEDWVDEPFQAIKEKMKTGAAPSCFCSVLLEDSKTTDHQLEFDVKWTANSMYAASLDTTITVMSHFIHAMVNNPDVVAKAQKEIDAIVGNGRLPNFKDRANLPYVECVWTETLRWAVPVPLGLPHRLMEDDVYKDMFLGKGSLIFANIWAMLRDEKLYPNPEQFNPERYQVPVDEVTEKKRDPRHYVFGFGRRQCPGKHLIESSGWLLMAAMLATLDFKKAVDEHGNVIEPDVTFDNSVFRTPSVFKCDIRPRSEQALKVIGGEL